MSTQTSSQTVLVPRRQSADLVWAGVSVLAAAGVIVAGSVYVDHGARQSGGPVVAAVSSVVALALAAGLFLSVVPRAEGSGRPARILAALAVLTLPVFWSAVPVVIGGAAAAAARRRTGRLGVAGAIGVGVMALILVWTVVGLFV
jgi:hypothetical protein